MQTVQFAARMKKNTIKVPRAYKNFYDQSVQVILVKEDKNLSCDLGRFAGTIRLREDPVRYQRRIRREWK